MLILSKQMESEMTYSMQCQMGRDHAAQVTREAAQTGNLPKMAQAIREAAKDETGFGAGFLFAICGEVVQPENRI